MTRKKTPKPTVKCLLDRDLVNAETLPFMKDVGLSIFASACSKNRGAFVLHPPDGHTYGCLVLPQHILDLAGVELDDSQVNATTGEPIFHVERAEDIMKHYHDKNLTAGQAVDLLDFIIDNVYQSTPNVEQEPYACDVSGIVHLDCNAPQTTQTIRAVTMAGVFTPALWATSGKKLSLDQASNFYSARDFQNMKDLGLNAVQIPVPVKMFDQNHPAALDWKDLLLDTLKHIRKAGLNVILVLDATDSLPQDVPEPVQSAALFAQNYNDHASDTVIIAVTLPAMEHALTEAAKNAAPDVPLWIPTKGGDFRILQEYPLASAAALELSHTATVGDVASSTSQEDRAKLFYHETMACIARVPLEYSTCFQDTPVVVSSGFNLAIDDCHLKGISDTWRDYGQCERFNETIGSEWWTDHRFSFAARQLFAYEKGLGWSYAAWKLWDTDPHNLGVLDTPEKLLAFQEVHAAGLMPSLWNFDKDEPPGNNTSPVPLACLNPPVNDFVLGDATLAPTPAPPPSCGNGWWNFTTEKCDYWIPPTPAPTAPCPICPEPKVEAEESQTSSPSSITDVPLPSHTSNKGNNGAAAANKKVAVESFFSGAIIALLVVFVISRFIGRGRRSDYQQLPTNDNNYQSS